MKKETLPLAAEWALVGPASSGKSTIVEIFKHTLHNTSFAVLEDPVRPYFANHFDIFKASVHKQNIQQTLQQEFLNQEREAHAQTNKTVLLRDGSLFDPTILTEFFGDREGADNLFENVKDKLGHYSGFFLLSPHGVPYEPDPLRQETPNQRLESFTAYRKFLDRHNLPYKILEGPLDERVNEIETVIYQYIPTATILQQLIRLNNAALDREYDNN